MFARTLNAWMNRAALTTGAVMVLVVGMACCKGPDSCSLSGQLNGTLFSSVGRGANVIPLPTATADTLARVMATLVTNADNSITYVYTVGSAPNGTIDSVAIYTAASGAALPPTASAILCATAVACTGSGTSATIGTGFPALLTALRGYGAQLVVFTTTRQMADGGAIRGVIYPFGVVDHQGC